MCLAATAKYLARSSEDDARQVFDMFDVDGTGKCAAAEKCSPAAQFRSLQFISIQVASMQSSSGQFRLNQFSSPQFKSGQSRAARLRSFYSAPFCSHQFRPFEFSWPGTVQLGSLQFS
eukprot:scaffold75130_cov21-Prasinocladus_malaysianus.AAC.1